MSRAERLLRLMETLRGYRRPVTGAALAEALGISLRTLYRDIDSLRAQGAAIEGEAGLGYVLKPGFTLPPLMFQAEELEALLLGARWVAAEADPDLARAAHAAMVRIGGVLPAALATRIESVSLFVGPSAGTGASAVSPRTIRAAIDQEVKARITYADADGGATQRVIWPFALAYFSAVRIIVAWCELRADFRHFRLDRVTGWETLTDRMPRRRAALIRDWRARESIPEPPF